MKKPKLKRELTLLSATFYGIGIILGAGIYALIGQAAGIAGNDMWISFLVAAILAAFTGLSYAELSSMFPKSGAEYIYTFTAFRKRSLSFIVGWLFIVSGIVASATVALGFSGYFTRVFYLGPIMLVPIAIILIAVLSLINYWGMKETSNFNIIATLMEMSGLFIIIFLGIGFLTNFTVDVSITHLTSNIYPILAAAALIFFAFIGFEDVVNVAEETKKAKKIIPKALVIAIFITAIIYVLVAISSLAILGPEALAASNAPLADVAAAAAGSEMLYIMAILAMASTINTVLLLLVVGSRFMYGMARWNVLPKKLSKIHKHRNTPYYSIALTGIVTAALTLGGDILSVAEITTMSIFIIFIFVNASVIKLRFSMPLKKRFFKSPLNIGKVPILAVIGLVTSLAILFYFPVRTWIAEAIVIGLGLIIFLCVRKNKPKI